MKVKISNFPGRLICKIYDNHMNKKYGYVDWPKEQSYEDHVLEAINDGIQRVYNVFNWIWFDRRTQKVSVKIDRWDTWSMDHTLAPIILPMLKQLKATKHGAPYVDPKDCPEELKPKKQTKKQKDNGETDSTHFERWDWIMDEMIHAFEQKNKDDWMAPYYEYNKWDTDAVKAEQERISNGFRLFGKYYESLWD